MGSLSQDFFLQVAKGKIDGHAAVHVSGHIHSLGTAFKPVWSAGVDPFPAAAGVVKISSSDANDAAAGTGARTVTIMGLNASGAAISETVTLNGQTAVNTINSFLRINEMAIITAGSGGENAGNVWAGTGTVTAGVPATKYNVIEIAKNKSLSAFYTIPLNKKGYLLKIITGVSTNLGAQVETYIRESGGVYCVRDEFHFRDNTPPFDFPVPREVPALADILMRARVDAGTGDLSAGFCILLIDD